MALLLTPATTGPTNCTVVARKGGCKILPVLDLGIVTEFGERFYCAIGRKEQHVTMISDVSLNLSTSVL